MGSESILEPWQQNGESGVCGGGSEGVWGEREEGSKGKEIIRRTTI